MTFLSKIQTHPTLCISDINDKIFLTSLHPENYLVVFKIPVLSNMGDIHEAILVIHGGVEVMNPVTLIFAKILEVNPVLAVMTSMF